jgi:hypothetical protein
VTGHLVPLTGDWALWRDFAVRSAGFPVSGLDVFGSDDEPLRLRAVAADPRFVEAVTWQNPAAVENAVLKLIDGRARKPSRRRQHEELVASYWQRYCGKNDTIGFFGPLAWGRIGPGEQPLRLRAGELERERVVHLESWGVQALAEAIDPELRIATGPYPERDLRVALERHEEPAVRERGLAMLDRLEAARDAVAAAAPQSLRRALADLDATFVELTAREPVRNAGRAYGARTLSYVDSMRDLDVELGPEPVADMRPALETLFEACRWYCGRVHAVGARIVEESLPDRAGSFVPVLVDVIRKLMEPPGALAGVVAELERRLSVLLRDPDPATIGARAAALFADHEPAWRHAVFHSVDIQLAARDAAAVAAGDYLTVVGDVHPGNNPLGQGLFAHRYPDQAAFWRMMSGDLGPAVPLLLPPFGPGLGVDGRGFPATSDDTVHIAVLPETRAQNGRRTWLPHELLIDGTDVVDRRGELRVPLVDVFGMAIFISGVRVFELLPELEHAPRTAIGRTVIRRESWSIHAADVPSSPEAIPAFARSRGMPRRVFAKSPLERKPMYLDTQSPVLAQILCRHVRRAAAEAPGSRIRFTEMLPTPDQCWLADGEGNRYVSELRVVAVDRSRRFGGGEPPEPAVLLSRAG